MNKTRILEVYLSALEIERIIGVPALFTTAQAVQESSWDIVPIIGKDGTNANNIFGIKGKYNGRSVVVATKEWVSGKWITIEAEFKAYPNLAECIKDHAKLLVSAIKGAQTYSYLDCLIDYRKDRDIAKYVKRVAKIYATDPNYAESILNIMTNLRKIIDEQKSWKIEQEEAKTWAVTENILKPDGSPDYWDKPLNRQDLVVVLKRFKKA